MMLTLYTYPSLLLHHCFSMQLHLIQYCALLISYHIVFLGAAFLWLWHFSSHAYFWVQLRFSIIASSNSAFHKYCIIILKLDVLYHCCSNLITSFVVFPYRLMISLLAVQLWSLIPLGNLATSFDFSPCSSTFMPHTTSVAIWLFLMHVSYCCF